jgi:23S rRNA (adenine2503-C2)-methyltransferase
MNLKKLKQFLDQENQPTFRFQQIVKAVFQGGVGEFNNITTISKDLREKMNENIDIFPFNVKEILTSQDGRAIKALLELQDGRLIETVLISPKPATWSACISAQVGCAMACDFCATGKLGLSRDLTSDEIVSQAIFWRYYLRKNKVEGNYTNIVYMGMGEPFMNWKNVQESVEILTDEKLGNFPNRGLSISTSGVVPGIKKFADTFSQVHLAISLHFATDEKRDKYMPVNKAYNLASLKEALQYYLAKNRRRIFIEYLMLKNINDSQKDAVQLTDYLKSIGENRLLIVNLIKFNATEGNFISSTAEQIQRFKDKIKAGGIACTIRKSLGDDIQSACGQLAGSKK